MENAVVTMGTRCILAVSDFLRRKKKEKRKK